MSTEIFIAESDLEIESCFPAFKALRAHLEQRDFLQRVRRQQAQTYHIVALRHQGIVKSVAGFRFAEHVTRRIACTFAKASS